MVVIKHPAWRTIVSDYQPALVVVIQPIELLAVLEMWAKYFWSGTSQGYLYPEYP